VCREVGLKADDILLGGKVETMTDDELAEALETTHIFARLSPAHKQRIIRGLQHKQHVVGFMGDGINDAPALHVADVGISVDSAVDIAKAAAAVILLEKDLMVLEAGVIEGRKVFVNILKYVRMGASSNFGNMFSVIGASAFLPFVPIAPIQVLNNNLLYYFCQVPISTDTFRQKRPSRGRGTSATSKNSSYLSDPSARFSTTRPFSSCSMFSVAGIPRAPRCSKPAGSLNPSLPRH
jgi:Mg2+-importing ATPase